MESARQLSWQVASPFEPDGTLLYRPEPGNPDHGSTLCSRRQRIHGISNPASAGTRVFSEERQLIAEVLRLLRAMDKFRNGFARRANGEIPPHTSDIYAAGLAVHGALCRGITATGIQMTWKQNDADRQGLLPDVFHLRLQMRAGSPINWGTVQTDAVRRFNALPVYSLRADVNISAHPRARTVRPRLVRTPLRGAPRRI